MTWEEVTTITKQADFNCSGKLDYNKFCELYLSTREQCCKAARDRLEVDPRLRQQQFGNETENSSEGIPVLVSKASPRISRKSHHKLVTAELLQDLHQLKVAKLLPPPLSLWVPAAAGTQS